MAAEIFCCKIKCNEKSGGNGCDNNNRTANLVTASALWWQDWFGLRGIEGTDVDPAVANGGATGLRVAGTDSIHVQSVGSGALPILVHDAAATNFTINAATAPFDIGDVMLVCDFDHAVIFQATAYDDSTQTLTHANGGGAPGNCASGLGFPTICDGGVGNLYTFTQNSQVGQLTATAWYIGNNGRAAEGGRSLYRIRLGSGATENTEEVVAGVTDMQVRYGVANQDNPVVSTAVVDWNDVTSVFITLTVDSADTNVTTDPTVNSGRIQRTFNYLITLRNHVQ